MFVGVGVQIGVFCSHSGLCGFSVKLYLAEPVRILRNSEEPLSVTWASADKVGVVGTEAIRHLRNTVKDMVDEFLNDYLAANPLAPKP